MKSGTNDQAEPDYKMVMGSVKKQPAPNSIGSLSGDEAKNGQPAAIVQEKQLQPEKASGETNGTYKPDIDGYCDLR